SRSDSFHIPPGVSLYGGFAGGEEELEERNWEENPTVLSGDIGRDDDTDERGVVTDVDNIEGLNAYHVVWLDGTTTPITTSTRLDGVIITAGQANGGDVPDDVGGGLYCNGGGPGSMCSPSLTNVTFSGNGASSYGGAMYNAGHSEGESSPTLTNVTFSGNSATSNGGAMYNSGSNSGQSSPTLTNVTFAGNRAEYGGAMANVGLDGISSPTLTNVTFAGNRAGNDGG